MTSVNAETNTDLPTSHLSQYSTIQHQFTIILSSY